MSRTWRRRAGFTVLELLVTISIAAVLAAIAIPSFRNFVLTSQRAQITNDLLSQMQFARSEAIRRGRVVSLCPSTNGTACSSANDWKNGWIVFVNLDGDSPAEVDSGEEVLRVASAVDAAFTLTGAPSRYNFRPFNKASTNGTIKICDSRGASAARAVIVSQSGSVRISDKDANNNALTCP